MFSYLAAKCRIRPLLALKEFICGHQPTRTKVVECIIYVKPIVTVELPDVPLSELGNAIRDPGKKWLDSVAHFSKISFLLELVAVDLDCSSAKKETVKACAWYCGWNVGWTMLKYKCVFKVPAEFGEIGAVLIQNVHHKEAYIKNIFLNGNVTFTCESWIQSKENNPSKRIFFTNKSYLPSETPKGLKSLREEDLESLRGNGKGERKPFERIYDYDTYNDLGDPDNSFDLARPVLGGTKHPYPRRCRTGRPVTSTDSRSESRKTMSFCYVPRDEEFSDTKFVTFGGKYVSNIYSALQKLLALFGPWMLSTLCSALNYALKALVPPFVARKVSTFYSALKNCFPSRLVKFIRENKVSVKVRELAIYVGFEMYAHGNASPRVLRRLIEDVASSTKTVQQMETDRRNDNKSFCWYDDEEFCRQTLAGINPYSIRLVTEWPLMSKLDPQVYGPPESMITKEFVEQQIMRQEGAQGFMTLEQALGQKKLFLLDYHDLLLPYVNKVRELEGTTLYGSRTLMFLTSTGILTPLTIELTRPPKNGKTFKPYMKYCYIPDKEVADGSNAVSALVWTMAKAHVVAHDSGYHQLVSHWLRTHCVTEPYIIATNRQLSKMHPIQRLLCPHFRYTMRINSLARQFLINAGGIIESNFSLGKYSMQLSSDAYAQQWRFDHEALPADLISRGMAVEDPSAPHGLKLRIEDYPFANDGLILWDAIEQWATAYVNHYYPQANLVESDEELQAWWTEIRTVGHADKKDEPWWPQLKTQQNLIRIVSTIMWVASGHHSAVNFGQYTAKYYPTRPTITRTNLPQDDPTNEKWQALENNRKDALQNCFPSPAQTTNVMSTLDTLSSHSPDEEYIGIKMEAAWEAEPAIKTAFQVFSESLKKLENYIDSRNSNPYLKNRIGKGSVRYELLKPFSEPGVTGKGVPYSISI